MVDTYREILAERERMRIVVVAVRSVCEIIHQDMPVILRRLTLQGIVPRFFRTGINLPRFFFSDTQEP